MGETYKGIILNFWPDGMAAIKGVNQVVGSISAHFG